MNGTTEGRGSDSRSRPRAAVKVDAADPRAWEKCPGMVRGIIGVVEGHAIVVDVIVAVCESTEECFSLSQADSIGIHGESSWGHFRHFAEVIGWRDEILNKDRVN